MAEHVPTTQKAGAEGRTVALTMENYPKSLRGYNAQCMADDCTGLVKFLREAVIGIFVLHKSQGTPSNERDLHDMWNGYGMVCDLLVDRLNIASGEGLTPMPLLKDLEAHHG